jgi:hypothetical protein
MQLDKIQLTTLTNELFKLFIVDLTSTKQVTIYQISKVCLLPRNFIYNKMNNYSIQYVSLNTLYLICKQYNFTFDLLKYINQLESK